MIGNCTRLRGAPHARICRRTGTSHSYRDSSKSLSAAAKQVEPDNGVRRNQVGIQMLPEKIQRAVFPLSHYSDASPDAMRISREHLQHHRLSTDPAKPQPVVDLELPRILGSNLDEHFTEIARRQSQKYKDLAQRVVVPEFLRPPPAKFRYASGWTRYMANEKAIAVAYPKEDVGVFDVEILPKDSAYPIMATLLSPGGWYSWTSPYLTGQSDDPRHLIPFGPSPLEQLVVGHAVSFDRARISEQYSIRPSKLRFLDTLSMHVAVSGMTSRQRIEYQKYMCKNADTEPQATSGRARYFDVTSMNSLASVADLYCNLSLDKSDRDFFLDGELADIRQHFQELMAYCSRDVLATTRVFQRLFPMYLHKNPHPVSMAGILEMSTMFLPTTQYYWQYFVRSAEDMYRKLRDGVDNKLQELVKQALHTPDPHRDPWLKQLDWTITPLRMTKGKKNKDGTWKEPPRPHTRQLLPGKPAWYRALYSHEKKAIHVSMRTRVAPLLLRLRWHDFPLHYSKRHGWVFRVPRGSSYRDKRDALRFTSDPDDALSDPEMAADQGALYYKVPHKDGELARCGNPMAKEYIHAAEKGILTSELPAATEALQVNATCSYWISSRQRIKSQFVVYSSDVNSDMGLGGGSGNVNTVSARQRTRSGNASSNIGIIIPFVSVMGTVTRRAVEPTWMTASNLSKDRIGSELKSVVRAPPGYKIVGADVDSQELWIASVLGDAQFRIHGGSAIGWMTLQGSKSNGTDLHSRTAEILGISRNDAKVFNYGRIYGAGVRFSTQLLQQFNPHMTKDTATTRANDLYASTKGIREHRSNLAGRPFWHGGTESYMFNSLEEIALGDSPRTPVLGCLLTDALLPENLQPNQYTTSRINWVVQSSAVDYLHLMLVAMKYLIERYGIDARFMLSVHDEVRYLVAERDQYRAALALQIANLWTRALFSFKLGMEDLPQSVAFFSSVDVDHVLRKEVDLDCVTVSNQTPIAPGQAFNIHEVIARTKGRLFLGDQDLEDKARTPRKGLKPRASARPLFDDDTEFRLRYLRAQALTDISELEPLQAGHSPHGRRAAKRRRSNESSADDYSMLNIDPFAFDAFS